jgi:two-component system sensor histidine kinase/response regulator
MTTSEPHLKTDNPSNPSQDVRSLDGLQIMLAEDCPDQGRLYLMFLQSSGANVTLECTGQSAVDTFQKTDTQFDAVLMDFQMPELDGIDATRQLREQGYQGAILALTAFDSVELRQSWFQAGCNEFLKKPLKKDELVSTILNHTMA